MAVCLWVLFVFFFQAEDGIRDGHVTGVQTCALPISADRSMPFVCVQPAVTSWSRRSEDLTHDKTDEKDAVLIARLTAQLRCYVPEPIDPTWARLRHLGARREQLITEVTSQVQQIRDLLECVWPAALDTARQPFRSQTWTAALEVILDRDRGEF